MCMENFASHNFSGEQQNQLSMEYALKLTELEANIKLTQAELEANIKLTQAEALKIEANIKLTQAEALNLETNMKLTQAEALKSIVQSESMIKSVRDNALISKANCYVGFLNVVLNAQNTSANDKGNTHQNNVVSTISKIGTNAQGELDELENYTNILNELKNDILALTT